MAAHKGFSSLDELEEYIEEKDIKNIHIATNPGRSLISIVFQHRYQIPQKIAQSFQSTIINEIRTNHHKLREFFISGYQTNDTFLNNIANALRECHHLTHLTVNNCQHRFDGPISPFVLLLEHLHHLRVVTFRDDASWLDEANINKIIEILQSGHNKSIQEVDITDSWYIDYSEKKDDFTTTSDLDEYRRERHDMLDRKIPEITAITQENRKMHFKSSRRLYAEGRKHDHDDDEIEKALVLYHVVQNVIKKGGKVKFVE